MSSITLSCGQVVLFDDEDAALVEAHSWYRVGWHDTCPGYAATRIDGRLVPMHKLITGRLGPTNMVDHRDGDRFNNRRSNLRPATKSQNAVNWPRPVKLSGSPYRGVYPNGGRWRAAIKVDGKQRHLGNFADDADAARAFDQAAREAWGEFAMVNFNDD